MRKTVDIRDFKYQIPSSHYIAIHTILVSSIILNIYYITKNLKTSIMF